MLTAEPLITPGPASTIKTPELFPALSMSGSEEHPSGENTIRERSLASIPPTRHSQLAAASLWPQPRGGAAPTPPGKYLALPDPGRPGRPKLRVSSRWEQPSFWHTSHRCSVLSSSSERSQPWGRGDGRGVCEVLCWGDAVRLPTWTPTYLAGKEVQLGDSGCLLVQACQLHTWCAISGGAVKETTRVEPPTLFPSQPRDSPNSLRSQLCLQTPV